MDGWTGHWSLDKIHFNSYQEAKLDVILTIRILRLYVIEVIQNDGNAKYLCVKCFACKLNVNRY